jgi:prepilin-type N-terminal cleavage/methylation domain-containing protein
MAGDTRTTTRTLRAPGFSPGVEAMDRSMEHGLKPGASIVNIKLRRGFTLIELLVVIAVIAVIVSILLPALSKARKAGMQTKELSAIRQATMGYLSYSQDNRGALMPGYLRASWARIDAIKRFLAWDNQQAADDSQRLTGSALRPYPWRLMPYIGFSYTTMILDRNLYSAARSRVDDPAERAGYQMTVARNPSFGLNTTWLGGDAHRGAFYTNSQKRWGTFYLERIDQVTFPDKLIVFASSRGYLRDSGSQIVPGYHRIEGPWHSSPTSSSVPAFLPWTIPVNGKFDASRPPADFGHLDFRYFDRAAVSTVDGHAAAQSLRQVNDMRRWANQATKQDWHPR